MARRGIAAIGKGQPGDPCALSRHRPGADGHPGRHRRLHVRDLAAAIGPIRQGGLRALAVTTSRRVPAIPDVPMMSETILPGFDAYSFVSWWVPARTPDAAVRRVNQVALHALGQADVQVRVQESGFLSEGTSVERARDFIAAEAAKGSGVIRARNLRFEEG